MRQIGGEHRSALLMLSQQSAAARREALGASHQQHSWVNPSTHSESLRAAAEVSGNGRRAMTANVLRQADLDDRQRVRDAVTLVPEASAATLAVDQTQLLLRHTNARATKSLGRRQRLPFSPRVPSAD